MGHRYHLEGPLALFVQNKWRFRAPADTSVATLYTPLPARPRGSLKKPLVAKRQSADRFGAVSRMATRYKTQTKTTAATIGTDSDLLALMIASAS